MLQHSSHWIERLWRDVFRCVVGVFHQLFYHLEDCGKLDPLSDIDVYCLHLVYLPRINEALLSFADGWNSHAMSSERCLTPLQLFSAGSILGGLRSQIQVDGSDDVDRLLTSDIDIPSSVEVPPTEFSLSSEWKLISILMCMKW